MECNCQEKKRSQHVTPMFLVITFKSGSVFWNDRLSCVFLSFCRLKKSIEPSVCVRCFPSFVEFIFSLTTIVGNWVTERESIGVKVNIRPELRFINQMKHSFLILFESWWMRMKLAGKFDLICLQLLRFPRSVSWRS